MTQIFILLLVVLFSLFLIRHGRIHRKISLLLFGIVLLFALPLSMYKDASSFNIEDNTITSYLDSVRENTDKNDSTTSTSITSNSSSNNDIDIEIDFGAIAEAGENLFQIGKDVSDIKEDLSSENSTSNNTSTYLNKISGLYEEVVDFFEFISGSNVSDVELNTEEEVVVVGSNYANDKSDVLELHLIDVGQGDSLLLKKGELEILIDGGPNDSGKKLLQYLKGNFVKEIDLLIATHPHEDHIGGLDIVLDAIPVKRIIDSGDSLDTKTYDDYISSAKASGAEFVYDNNLLYDYGDVKVQIIELGDNYKNTNDNSVVAIISYNGINILSAGDLEEDLEDDLTQILRKKNIKIDLYKASHHGSKTSNTKGLLDYINPSLVLISAGEDNKYNHPNKEAMANFLDITDRVYSTHKSGNLKFYIKDEILGAKDYYNLTLSDSNDYN